jgi:plastocyanin
MKKSFVLLGIAALVLSLVGSVKLASAATIVPLASVQSGDLIRGQAFAAVYYYGRDGFRYVFPNDKTYFTWYNNFDSVKWLTDADLAKVQIGGNVTYKPGVKMIKINSDPKTYAIARGGTLRWVPSEAIAVSLYGSTWNKKIDDVPDGFFSNYKAGADIQLATDYSVTGESADATSIDIDKGLKAPTYIDIMNNAFAPSTVTISAGTAVKWVNKDGVKHTATADDVSWGTGTLEAGQNFSRYFKTPGTYTYFCSYHPEMKGTIVVQ